MNIQTMDGSYDVCEMFVAFSCHEATQQHFILPATMLLGSKSQIRWPCRLMNPIVTLFLHAKAYTRFCLS